MDGLLQDSPQFSQLELLVTQQRYDESLKLLNDAIAKNPRDRHAYLCRLLVVRIVVLRRQLAQLPRLRWSKLKIPSIASVLARPATAVGRAFSHAADWWRRRKPMPRLRGAADVVVSAGQGLRAAYAGLRQRAWASSTARFGLFSGDQGFRAPLRAKPLRVTTVSALSVIVAIAVSAILLRNADTGHPEVAAVQPRVAVPPTAAREPAAPVPPQEAQSPTPTEPTTAASADRAPVEQETTEIHRPQPPAPARSQISTGEAQAAPKPAAKEPKPAADFAARQSQAAAKKQQAARDAAVLARAKQRPAGDAVAKASSQFYRTRRPITVRQQARYAAPTVDKLSEGTIVAVLDVKNSWARVTLDGKAPGFVRIEHLGPVEIP